MCWKAAGPLVSSLVRLRLSAFSEGFEGVSLAAINRRHFG
jgi:hypothetical protein